VNVLGLNAYHGDAAAAIVVDGRLAAAAEEERFTRVKHTAGFPSAAVRYCLEAAGLEIGDVDHVAISRNPGAHVERKLLFALTRQPGPGLVRDRLRNAARVGNVRAALARGLGVSPARIPARMHRVEHHRAHMASSFLASPFDEAACLSIDGFGDFVSAMFGRGRGHAIETLGFVPFPHSLGIFYTAVTQYLGFPHYGDEYKVMGLASYGQPEYLQAFRTIVRPNGCGYRLDLKHFVHHTDGVAMVWDSGAPSLGRIYSDGFVRRFGPPREPAAPIEQRHRNIAASVQALTEEVVFHLLHDLHARTGLSRLCLAGGVAFNSVLNGKIAAHTPFDEVYVQPAAGDAGTALGAALAAWHDVSGAGRRFEMRHAAWGPAYSDADVRSALDRHRVDLERARARGQLALDEEQLVADTAEALAAGEIIGWFQGRMEWGARALGQRSILADPRREATRDLLNRRIKRRESFRPFCPSILRERMSDFFGGAAPDPFMVRVHPIRPDQRARIPAVTHVDGTGRPQAVDRGELPLYWRLIHAFERRTGVPVVLNTSFNESEPIVRSPDEALDCFLRTDIDRLVLGRWTVARQGRSGAEARAIVSRVKAPGLHTPA
jgi:carbamoyltransferase